MGGSGRNNSMSGPNRYSNRRQHDRPGGDDAEEDYRGGSKYNNASRGSNRGHPHNQSHSNSKGKDNYKPRGSGLKEKDDHHQAPDHANSIDRGEKV